MTTVFKGRTLEYNLARQDLAKYYGSDSLVYYVPGNNTVAVDENASEMYAKYAAIHELICRGPYSDMAPNVSKPNQRCYYIDRIIIDSMDKIEDKREYIKKRIEMFSLLIEKDLNPDLNEAFKHSLKHLKELLAHLD